MESPLECQEREMIWKSPGGRDQSVSARSWQPILLLEERQLESATQIPAGPVLSLRHFLCLTMNSSFPEGENTHF